MRNVEGQTQGEKLEQFERDFAAFTGAEHAFAVANATDALSLAATLCRVGPGDEVIIPAYTFCASAIPFGKAGAKIVWGDMPVQAALVQRGTLRPEPEELILSRIGDCLETYAFATRDTPEEQRH